MTDLEYSQEGARAEIVLNQPGRKNALSQSMWQALEKHLNAIRRQQAIRVLVIRGTGDAFSAGADISEFETIYATPESARAANAVIASALQSLDEFPLPSIAVIKGPCMGGGCALAMACDISIADKSARFGINPTALGTVYSFRDSQRLVNRVGIQNAKRFLIGAAQIDADTALEWGLISQVAESGELDQMVKNQIHTILNLSPDALAGTREILRAIDSGTTRQTSALQDIFNRCFSSEDFSEGVRAFLHKRPPKF